MNEIDQSILSADEKILSAHEFLKLFITEFDTCARGGVHDFMEISIYNMINLAVKNIDNYLKTGHKSVDASEILHIVTDSYQQVLDNMKRNLEKMQRVNFK